MAGMAGPDRGPAELSTRGCLASFSARLSTLTAYAPSPTKTASSRSAAAIPNARLDIHRVHESVASIDSQAGYCEICRPQHVPPSYSLCRMRDDRSA